MTSATLLDRACEPTPVLLLLPRTATVFADIAVACYGAGVEAMAVDNIAEIERWPIGEIVVADLDYLTPFWLSVGAAHVIAVVEDAAQGRLALERGATEWVLTSNAATYVPAFARTAGVPTLAIA
jgi:hypothetical protein